MSADPVKWNVRQYAKFINERTRPAVELLGRISLESAQTVMDLGCGPGNSTALLKDRWPDAQVAGIDNSQEMLAVAAKENPGIEFAYGDISSWQPESSVDIIFSNAALQWVPNHRKLLPRLASYLNAGGFFAMQVPHNHLEPTHTSMREVALKHPWSVDLSRTRQEPPVLSAQNYYDILRPHLSGLDIWETKYFHVMNSFGDIAEWLKGTGLRPFIEPLAEDERTKFLGLYEEELRKHMQPQADGKVLLPFPRLFIVAHR